MQFFQHLRWIDGRKLTDVIESYRAQLLTTALYTFDPDGTPTYNLVLSGRGKKNWKSTDLALASLYKVLVWRSALGNDVYLLANDERQARDDLVLIKKLIAANVVLEREVEVKGREIVRLDNRGTLQVLPAGDVIGAHGLSYLFIGFDEIHGYKDWSLLEALALDPHRPDAMQWITSYASLYNSPGNPLHDLIKQGKTGDDPRMLFSWYAADFTTDPDHDAGARDGEERANPSLDTFPRGRQYLDQQRRRLPTSKYRRLHLNLPGSPEGAFYDPSKVMEAIVPGRRRLKPQPEREYVGFVDMSGGSSDDATLAVAHRVGGGQDAKLILDLVTNQSFPVPFNPRSAVKRFADRLKKYGLTRVTGDRFAGETFRRDFEDHGITYFPCTMSKRELYEQLEPELNAGAVELLDVPQLQEQLLTLVQRGQRIDHQSGDHDDWANAAAGALVHVAAVREYQEGDWDLIPLDDPIEGEEGWHPHPGSGLVSGLVEEQDIGWRQ